MWAKCVKKIFFLIIGGLSLWTGDTKIGSALPLMLESFMGKHTEKYLVYLFQNSNKAGSGILYFFVVILQWRRIYNYVLLW